MTQDVSYMQKQISKVDFGENLKASIPSSAHPSHKKLVVDGNKMKNLVLSGDQVSGNTARNTGMIQIKHKRRPETITNSLQVPSNDFSDQLVNQNCVTELGTPALNRTEKFKASLLKKIDNSSKAPMIDQQSPQFRLDTSQMHSV